MKAESKYIEMEAKVIVKSQSTMGESINTEKQRFESKNENEKNMKTN